MQTRLTHVRVNVRDLNQAIEWYCQTLGFELRNTWPPDVPNYADFVVGQGATFAIAVAEPIPTGSRLNFEVEDVDGLWEQLKDKVEIVEPLFDTAWGTRKFTIRDVDGNELGLVQA